jgi:hypothetical protein
MPAAGIWASGQNVVLIVQQAGSSAPTEETPVLEGSSSRLDVDFRCHLFLAVHSRTGNRTVASSASTAVSADQTRRAGNVGLARSALREKACSYQRRPRVDSKLPLEQEFAHLLDQFQRFRGTTAELERCLGRYTVGRLSIL